MDEKYLLDYIRMFDAFQKGDLADGRTWHTVVLLLQFDFLKCYDLNIKTKDQISEEVRC